MVKKSLYGFILFLVSNNASSQNISETVATTIANKLKDSLSLTEKQAEKIFKLNVILSEQKNNMRHMYNGTDSLTKKIQRIENSRDSLYRLVLDEKQYGLYKQKKGQLVSSN